MEIRLYHNFVKRQNSTKLPTGEVYETRQVRLKDETSIMSPTFTLSDYSPQYNYIYVPKWGRYYFIDDVTLNITGTWDATCTFDALASYKASIGATTTFIERTSDSRYFQKFIRDGAVSSEDRVISTESATTDALTKQIAQEYADSNANLQKAAHNQMAGLQEGWIVSENGQISFSKDGKRLFFGTAPKPLEKDTTLAEFEQPQLDIWTWNEDYLQTVQLFNKNRDMKRTYTAYINTSLPNNFVQLGTLDVPNVNVPNEKQADWVLVGNDKKYRIQSQWDYSRPVDLYLVNVKDGSQKLIKENVCIGGFSFSPNGQYAVAYDKREQDWFFFNVATGEMTNLTENMGVSFVDDEHDTPSLASANGSAVWFENNYVQSGKGRFITLSEAMNDDLSSYKAIWVNVDRVGLSSLSNIGISANVILGLKKYVENGGNLFVTKQANQIIHAMGRIGYAPTWESNGYHQGADVWHINPHLCLLPSMGGEIDCSNHPIYTDLYTQIRSFEHNGIYQEYTAYPLVGEVTRTNNNNIVGIMCNRNCNCSLTDAITT